ncbi:MAG: TonB-dependent receptor [Sphingopyxis sp.]|uniref:TonB-dependent receptor plug domain-containing protein n=1 Tax=Sphingopyxis sp. TaxID=1908224 RepID=UPI002ABB2248|nr:TonB-dependent receptor [Sphingopyxis sp.]MDZ3831653.1 TonB-dependent receptor [Sphingopyxis sp.]
MPFPFRSASLLAIAIAVPTVSQADEGVLRKSDREYSITVTGERLDRERSNASWSLIDAAELQRAQNGSAADLIARRPGVSITRNGTLGAVTALRIRGAEGEQTLVVIDGVRVGDPSSPGGAFDFGNLMLGSIDRIELLRGANSLAWGSQAIGGVVSINMTQPVTGDAGATNGQINAEYGAHDTTRLNGQLRTGPMGPTQFGIGAGYVRTDGISNAAAGTERDGYRQYSLNLSNRTEIGETLSFSAFGLYANSRVDLDGFAAPAFTFGDTGEFQKTSEHYAAASIEHRPGAQASTTGFSHKLQFGIADINRDNFDPARGETPSFRARGRSKRLSYSIDWGFGGASDNGASNGLRLIAGAEREWTRSQTADAFSADAGRTVTTGLWAMLAGRPTNGLSLTAGVRHDDHRDFGSETSIALDAGQQLGDHVTVRASYREGFKAPTLFQLSEAMGAYGNPALRPERARSYEIGVRLSDGPWWFLDVAWFRRDSRDLIDFVTCPAGANALPAICATGKRPFGTYDNINRARAQGVEVDGAIQVTDRLLLRANYSLISTADRTAASSLEGKQLSRRPKHLANAEIMWSPGDAFAGTELSVAARYTGASYDDRANSRRLGEYWLVDLRIRYPLVSGIDVFARLENLLDTDYQAVAGYGTTGRSAYAGIRWAF